MYDDILLPTDGSDGIAAAVENACYVADLADARLHALFVVDARIAGATEWDMVVEREEERGEDAVEAIEAAGEQRGIPVEKHLRRGAPHEEILDAIDDYGADVIVMGTHGRTGLGRFMTAGSVAERVVRHSEIPVMTARARSD
ncbi:universal stress protein [Halorubrum sp. DTA98]|uniref:universal stress protein n=1 Tax=Halorubrum sp. DTA98 TaxID=3402163 RepID=UPI003AAB6F2E